MGVVFKCFGVETGKAKRLLPEEESFVGLTEESGRSFRGVAQQVSFQVTVLECICGRCLVFELRERDGKASFEGKDQCLSEVLLRLSTMPGRRQQQSFLVGAQAVVL